MALLIVSALFSVLVIPKWTHRWQNRQSELRIKAEVVNQIDEAVTSTIMAIQFAVLEVKSQSPADYDEAYRRWEVDRRLIASQLRTYYPGGHLAEEWNDLSERITAFYAGSDADNPRRQEYLSGWGETRDALFEQKDMLNAEIVGVPMPVFR